MEGDTENRTHLGTCKGMQQVFVNFNSVDELHEHVAKLASVRLSQGWLADLSSRLNMTGG